MALTAERLAEIDAELEAFGKSDDELGGVVQRARGLAETLAGDDALGELLDGLDDALAAAAKAAKESLPPRIEPMRRRPSAGSTAIGSPAPSEDPDSEDSEDEDDEPLVGSGLIELPEEELRKADLPPVLELEPRKTESGFPEERTDVVPPEDLEAAVDGGANSDIRGMSVDELFADAADDESGPMSAKDLEPFTMDEEEESIRLSDPEIELEAIQQAPPTPSAPPRPKTLPPPLPPAARAAKRPPKMDPQAFEEDESDSTQVMTAADLGGFGGDSDDFELLVDEDVIDPEEAPTEVDEETDVQDPEASGGGLISRILGRKQ